MFFLPVGCQFFITCNKAEWLDNKVWSLFCFVLVVRHQSTLASFVSQHVVFGKVIDANSMLTVRKIENVPTGPNNKPKLAVIISECGEL